MKLWPNLGGEEGRLSPAMKPGHPLREIARAWALLFASGTQILAHEAEDEPRAWPESLGPEPETACWDWLESGASAVAWWPDAEVRRAVGARGLQLDAPEPDVLAAVHDKAFTLEHARAHDALGGELGELVRAFDPEGLADARAVEAAVAAWPAWAKEHWVLKPRFGSTGRGRVHSTELVDPERFARALPRLAARGGAILEPWLERIRDFSVQLVVHQDGTVECLGSLHQLVKPGGAVLGGAARFLEDGTTHGADEHHERLVADAFALVEAAAARGFRGPCGVDAFAWRDAGGRVQLRSLCELNARFTTGHVAIGCALRARDAGLVDTGRDWRFVLAGGELALAGEGGPGLSLSGA